MSYKTVGSLITNLLILTVLLSGCTRITVSEEEELVAERFEPQVGYGNLYLVRKKTLFAALVEIEVIVNGQHIGPINIGTYHLLELRPGNYVIAAYAIKSDHKKNEIDQEIVAGKNHFIQIEPIAGFVPEASLEPIDTDIGKKMVVKGSRLITKPVEF